MTSRSSRSWRFAPAPTSRRKLRGGEERPSSKQRFSSRLRTMAASVTFLDARVGYRSWETMDRWAKARLAKANSKGLELVRIPIHKHGVGWGCTCPDHYIGSMEVAGTSTIWLEPTFEPTAVPVPATETRIAEGYFTGNTSPFRGDEATVVVPTRTGRRDRREQARRLAPREISERERHRQPHRPRPLLLQRRRRPRSLRDGTRSERRSEAREVPRHHGDRPPRVVIMRHAAFSPTS